MEKIEFPSTQTYKIQLVGGDVVLLANIYSCTILENGTAVFVENRTGEKTVFGAGGYTRITPIKPMPKEGSISGRIHHPESHLHEVDEPQ